MITTISDACGVFSGCRPCTGHTQFVTQDVGKSEPRSGNFLVGMVSTCWCESQYDADFSTVI